MVFKIKGNFKAKPSAKVGDLIVLQQIGDL